MIPPPPLLLLLLLLLLQSLLVGHALGWLRRQWWGVSRGGGDQGTTGGSGVHGRMHDGQPDVIHVWHDQDFLQQKEAERERERECDKNM